MTEEIKNEKVIAVIDEYNSLAITKGYGYVNKEGKQRYSVEDTYYLDDGKTLRKRETDKGIFYFPVELIDVVVESFVMKDGTPGSKTYPLSEVPYLAESYEKANEETLASFLKFKLHR